MHLVSGDWQMNTEMHYTRKFELVDSNAILCVSERDMLWSISKSGYFKLDRVQSSLFTWLYRKSSNCGHCYFRMVDVLGNKNSKCTPLDLSCNMKDDNDYWHLETNPIFHQRATIMSLVSITFGISLATIQSPSSWKYFVVLAIKKPWSK